MHHTSLSISQFVARGFCVIVSFSLHRTFERHGSTSATTYSAITCIISQQHTQPHIHAHTLACQMKNDMKNILWHSIRKICYFKIHFQDWKVASTAQECIYKIPSKHTAQSHRTSIPNKTIHFLAGLFIAKRFYVIFDL